MRWSKLLPLLVSSASLVACGEPPAADDGGTDAAPDSAVTDTGTLPPDSSMSVPDAGIDAASIDLTMPSSTVEFLGFGVALMCERFFDCCGAPTGDLAELIGTEEDCRNVFGLAQFELWNEVIASERAGRVELDVDAAHACLSAHVEMGCDIGARDVSPVEWAGCAGVVMGHVLAGSSCGFDDECETGFCAFPPDDAPRTCEIAPAIDEACVGRCAEGGHCADAVCVMDLAAGEACVTNAECSGACLDGVCADDAPFCDAW